MSGRLRGGGKRGASTAGRGRKADVSKDDVIDEMVLKLQRTLRSLVNCQIPALVTTLNHISQMKDLCEADNTYGLSLIGTFTTPQLQNLNLAAGSGNKDYKVNMVKSYVFQNDMKAIAMMESEIGLVKETMSDVCLFMLINTFSNDKGEIGWSDIQDHIFHVMQQRSRDEGESIARAKAKAKAAAGNAPADNDEVM